MQVGDVSMDQVKLLFGSIDILSLGYITRFQFEDTLRESGISLNDVRLEEVKKRLREDARSYTPPSTNGTGSNGERAQAYGDQSLPPPLQHRPSLSHLGNTSADGAQRIDLAYVRTPGTKHAVSMRATRTRRLLN